MILGRLIEWAESIVGMIEGRMKRDLDLEGHKILDIGAGMHLESQAFYGPTGAGFNLMGDRNVFIGIDSENLSTTRYLKVYKDNLATEIWALYESGLVNMTGHLDMSGKNIRNCSIVDTAKARAYLSTTMNDLTSGVSCKVLLDAESWDPGSNFDAVTNHRFVAPKTGYYLVCGGIQYASVVADKVYYLMIKGNSIATRYARYHSSIAENLMVNFSDIVYLAANDYVELWALHYAGVNTVDVGIGEGSTFMTVSYLSS